ncbi:sulfurtransferase complex subunit TusD [Enterobacteriaceae endosymbiont of Neohaemonia nigricornis]|uniref:sulfurtransferase complex subunit TusD n=1 Tax=Enterobacteriaceae endosymbiont of Neohaemonia nigricornis TaxID=2675792 RepID=UPI0014492058|nr:sulfurtransferase complex subunit TusD [Enterobacteriaceae endosymbiont of Neohaemonia nigricornis]QJC30517.1 sulfurtransferase complex subunit TusD [Enterobacteriaceae endosymbiont of Neohaemonia nigricornis]
MVFILLVTSAPFGTQNAYSAYFFAQTLIKEKYTLKSIFFYRDGVFNANKHFIISNKFNLTKSWIELSIKYNVDLHVCVNSSIIRGLLKKEYMDNMCMNQQNIFINKTFKIISLTTLAISILDCDRLVQF